MAGVALLYAFVVLPVVRRWSAREDMVVAAQDRVQRLRTLVRDGPLLAAEADAREAQRTSAMVRVIRERTPALAASALQAMLQDLAARSRVSITRLDVATAPDPASAHPAIPATLSAVTDIYGVADLLTRLQRHSTLIEVREVQVSSTSGLRGDLLQLSLTVQAPYLVEP